MLAVNGIGTAWTGALFNIFSGFSLVRVFTANLHILKFCICFEFVALCIQVISIHLHERRHMGINITSLNSHGIVLCSNFL